MKTSSQWASAPLSLCSLIGSPCNQVQVICFKLATLWLNLSEMRFADVRLLQRHCSSWLYNCSLLSYMHYLPGFIVIGHPITHPSMACCPVACILHILYGICLESTLHHERSTPSTKRRRICCWRKQPVHETRPRRSGSQHLAYILCARSMKIPKASTWMIDAQHKRGFGIHRQRKLTSSAICHLSVTYSWSWSSFHCLILLARSKPQDVQLALSAGDGIGVIGKSGLVNPTPRPWRSTFKILLDAHCIAFRRYCKLNGHRVHDMRDNYSAYVMQMLLSIQSGHARQIINRKICQTRNWQTYF